MSTALSLPTLPSGVTGPSHIPDLTESADIQTALKYLYYGSTGAANSANGIYGALSGLKTYVDAAVSGVNVHENVKAATLAGTPIPGVYAAGTTDQSGGTGIGAKITYSSTGVVTIDGVTLALNDRILVKDGTTALSGINSIANGVYYVSTLGAVGVACVLTRATDSDNSVQGEFSEGDFVFVSGGTTPNNNTSWILTSSSHTGTGPAGSIKIGTDPVTYVQFGAVTWGSQTANTFLLPQPAVQEHLRSEVLIIKIFIQQEIQQSMVKLFSMPQLVMGWLGARQHLSIQTLHQLLLPRLTLQQEQHL